MMRNSFSAKLTDEQTCTEGHDACSTGKVFGVPKRHLRATRVASPDNSEHPALTSEALCIDDATWLSEVCSRKPTTKGATLGNTQCGTMCEDDEATFMSTDCLRGTCQAPRMMRFPGFSLTFWLEVKAMELEASPPCMKRGTFAGRCKAHAGG
eukprot:5119645-Amphidinium_carterae.1